MKKENSKQPVGIFDSGIGGLTVANAISKLLPDEELIYFGDTAHMPYGDKSKDLIKHYALKISDFLLHEKKCKAIVIACNTASAAAYEYLRDTHKGIRPIINVIDPIIEAVISDEEIHRVGLIATKATVLSGTYKEKLLRRKNSLDYTELATPLLAPMIEEGFYGDAISHTVIERYLKEEPLEKLDALILGCTHYVIIRDEIDQYYDHRIKLFDSTLIVAEKLKYILEKEGLTNDKRQNVDHFYVSDFTTSFQKTARTFYGDNIILEKCDIWQNS